MKEDKIIKRIKELQNDRRFYFNLTNNVIDIVYREAIKDAENEYKKENEYNKENKKNKSEYNNWEDYDKKQTLIFKAKQEAYRNILDYINKHQDLTDVFIYVKEMAKKTKYDEIQIL